MMLYSGLIVCLSVVVVFLFKAVSNNKTRRRGLLFPPGPKPLPLLGNVLDIPMEYAWIKFTEHQRLYGDMVHLRALGQHIIVVNSTKIASDLLDKRSKIYSDRPAIPIAELMDWDFNTALLSYGEKWKYQRQIFNRTFRPQSALSYRPIQLKKVHSYMRQLLKPSGDLDALNRHLSASIIMKVVYGYNVESHNDPFVDVAQKATAMISSALLPGASLVNVLPILRYVPTWFPGAGFHQFAKESRKTVKEMKDAPMEFVRNNAAIVEGCLTSQLLGDVDIEGDLYEKENTIKEIAATAFAAGADTTVSSTLSIILCVLLYPEAARKAQDELDRVVGTSRLPNYDDRPSLPYVEAYYREIMRWHPVMPLGVPHSTTEDDVYNGYFIPKGAIVMSNIWAMTHDEEKYPEPCKFNPDRYFNADGQLNDDSTLLTFGFGRRLCPGQYLADATIWATLASVFAAFDISAAKDELGKDIKVEEKYTGVLVSHSIPFKCSITPRSEKARQLILDTIREDRD